MTKPLSWDGVVAVKGMLLPGYKMQASKDRGTEKNLLLKTWGGLGDEICAEPTLRFALDTFKDYEISLCSRYPDFFQHLKFKEVFNVLQNQTPKFENYHCFDLIGITGTLPWEFLCHVYLPCVDAPTLYAFRGTLPNSCKEIKLVPSVENFTVVDHMIDLIIKKPWIIIHAGKHWQSKTFPKKWWDRVLEIIIGRGVIPVLVGGVTVPSPDELKQGQKNRTTVDVETNGTVDLRGKLSLMESIALIQRSKVVLTNDSAILHMAASSDAHIGYITLAKHPDHLTHWRHGQWGWNMENLGRGGIWENSDMLTGVNLQDIGNKIFDWLPLPETFAEWGLSRV